MTSTKPKSRIRFVDLSHARDTHPGKITVGWPCHAYHVSIPTRRDPQLGLFEEVILKLLLVRRRDAEGIAEALCLPKKGLVEFVLARLRDLELISSSNDVLQRGEAEIDSVTAIRLRYEAGVVLKELVGGNVLPFVLFDRLEYSECKEWLGPNAKLEPRRESSGRGSNAVSVRPLILSDSIDETCVTPREVEWALRKHRELNRELSITSDSLRQHPVIISGGQILVSGKPQEIHLCCDLLLQPGTEDVVVLDPYGYGVSRILTDAYTRLIQSNEDEFNRVQDFRQKVARDWLDPDTGDARPAAVPLAVASRHRGTIDALKEARHEISKIPEVPSNSAEERDSIERRGKAMGHLYSAIEWALRDLLVDADLTGFELLLGGGDHESNAALLTEMASELGFKVDNASSRLLQVSGGAIKKWRSGGASMECVLSLNIAVANSDPLSPLVRIAREQPDWLKFLSVTKSLRDPAWHGTDSKVERAVVFATQERVRRCIRMLLPEIDLGRFASDPDPSKTVDANERLIDERLRARAAIDQFFGMQVSAIMPREARNCVMRVELVCQRLGTGDCEAQFILNDLCAALAEVLGKATTPSMRDEIAPADTMRNSALQAALHAGYALEDGALPEALQTTRVKGLRAILEGKKSTVSAHAVAFLALSDRGVLAKHARLTPRLLKLCSELADRRGHGNRSVLLPVEYALELKSAAYDAIHSLLEL